MEGAERKEGSAIRAPKELTLELIEERAMTEAEVESIASLLLNWWRREYEQERDKRIRIRLENDSDR
jgi:hypothetical protein